MRKLMSAKKYLPVALALAGFASIGTVPAFSQAQDHTGSMMPYYYDATGGQVWGSWSAQAPATVPHVTGQSSRPLYLYVPSRAARHFAVPKAN
jgi:hypothetical protein